MNTNASCGLRVQTALPVEVEDSLGLAAGEEPVAERGSAGWPVSCAGTGAGYAGMQAGSLLTIHKTTKVCFQLLIDSLGLSFISGCMFQPKTFLIRYNKIPHFYLNHLKTRTSKQTNCYIIKSSFPTTFLPNCNLYVTCNT